MVLLHTRADVGRDRADSDVDTEDGMTTIVQFHGTQYEIDSDLPSEDILAVYDRLLVSINHLVNRRALCMDTQLPDRAVRRCLAALGEAGLPIISEDAGGYRLTTDVEAVRRAAARFASYEHHCRMRRLGLERFANRNQEAQTELGL